jgi:iduronate 2-sulfatase
MRTERYRLVEWATNDRSFIEYELYDLKRDPDENANIARSPENDAIVKRLSHQLALGWQGALPE